MDQKRCWTGEVRTGSSSIKLTCNHTAVRTESGQTEEWWWCPFIDEGWPGELNLGTGLLMMDEGHNSV